MPILRKNRAQVISDLEDAIRARDASAEVGFGPIKDLIVDPVSLELRDLYLEVQRVYDIQFLQNAVTMDAADLDQLGESFGIRRKGPRRAEGSVFAFTASRPSVDIVVPAGIPVSTNSLLGQQAAQSFLTTHTVTLFAASADAYFNPAAGVFEVEAPIQAVVPGADSTVPAGTITQLQRQIPGLSGVTNKSGTIGGRDAETNLEYARRIRLALIGVGRGTAPGLRRFALTDDRAVDALVIQSGDPLMVRDEDSAGAVDVYVLGEEPTVVSEVVVFDGLDILPEFEPLIFPGAIVSVSGGIVGTLVEGTHYFVMPDPVLGGSARARNRIRWNRAASGLPAEGESVAVEYVYDKLVADLQAAVETADEDLLANVLMRRATAIDVRIAAVVKGTADEGQIRTALSAFVNTRGLGESVHPSDVDVVIRSVPGVDFVELPLAQLSRADETGSDIVAIAKNEYPRTSDALISLTLST